MVSATPTPRIIKPRPPAGEVARLPAPSQATPCRSRIEWNGLTGCRQIEVRRRKCDESGADPAAQREEHLVGEVCEPFC